MKIVIDIPDQIYETLINTGKYGYYRFDAKKAIMKGTPLSKECRLLDASKIKRTYREKYRDTLRDPKRGVDLSDSINGLCDAFDYFVDNIDAVVEVQKNQN